VVNAASFGFVIVSLLSLDTSRLHPVPPVPRGRGQLRAGLRYAVRVPAIIRPLLMMALAGTFTFEFEVSLPLLAETTFHGTATTYSWLLGALGAGAVAGGLYAARSARTGVARLIKASLGYAIAVGLLAVAPTLATAIAACVLASVASVIFLTTGNATIQLASDPEYRGRVTALWSMALVGSTPIGSPVIGALSDVASPRYALGLGAAACLAAAIIGGWPAGARSGDEPRYRDILAGRGRADVDMKELVIPEHRRVWVGPATMVGKRSGSVEQAAGEHQYAGCDTGMDPHKWQRKAGCPAQPHERPADQKLWCVHPHQVDRSRGQGQCPHHDQAGPPEGAGCIQQESGSCRAGNEEEDHRVIQALQALPPGLGPGTAVIQRANPEQRAHAG
jgi:Transmembrane secretion effector